MLTNLAERPKRRQRKAAAPNANIPFKLYFVLLLGEMKWLMRPDPLTRVFRPSDLTKHLKTAPISVEKGLESLHEWGAVTWMKNRDNVAVVRLKTPWGLTPLNVEERQLDMAYLLHDREDLYKQAEFKLEARKIKRWVEEMK